MVSLISLSHIPIFFFHFCLVFFFEDFFPLFFSHHHIHYITAVSSPTTPPGPPPLSALYPRSTPSQFTLRKKKQVSQRYQLNMAYFSSYWVSSSHVIIWTLSYQILLWSWENHLTIICPIPYLQNGRNDSTVFKS